MKLAITGGTGLVGSALAQAATQAGDDVTVVSRRGGPNRIQWTAEDGMSPADALSGFDAVVHLAGAGVADERWSDARKQEIMESRRWGTRAVVEALRNADPRPEVLISASAVGYYGDRGDVECPEDSPAGDDFLARVCVAWESEADAAEALGVRLVKVRIGLVLSRDGGALAKMLPAFKMGAGGKLGSGRQYMPWIHIDDTVGAIRHVLHDDAAQGVYNVTAPNPVDNRTFTKALGRAVSRPTFFSVPGFALKGIFGQLANALLIGQRAVPKRLLDAGYDFAHPELDGALSSLLPK